MKKLIIIASVFILAACGTMKEPLAVVETKNILIVPADELLVKCDVSSPPAVDEYVAGTWQEKEQLLIVYSSELLKNIFKCNKSFDALQAWKKKQVEAYSSK